MKKSVNYFLIAAIALMLFLSYKIIAPYLITIITAFILAYLTKPLYNTLSKKLNKSLSAIICIMVIIAVILIPLSLVITSIATETQELIRDPAIIRGVQRISEFDGLEKLNILEISQSLAIYMTELITSIISYFPSMIISLLLLIIGIFYALTNWENLAAHLKKYLPFKEKNKKRMINDIREKTNAIVFGSVLMAIIQAAITFIGFGILGVKLYFILSIIVFFLAFLPAVGPMFVWAPTALYYLMTENYFILIGIIIIGLILSYAIDTILRARLLGKNAKINPFIMLVGILGGISVFGIFGFIIGPLVLVYTIEIVERFIEEY